MSILKDVAYQPDDTPVFILWEQQPLLLLGILLVVILVITVMLIRKARSIKTKNQPTAEAAESESSPE